MNTNDKRIIWANVREQADQIGYIELDQISKNRWKVTLDDKEYIVKCPQNSYYLDVLYEALTTHLHQSQ